MNATKKLARKIGAKSSLILNRDILLPFSLIFGLWNQAFAEARVLVRKVSQLTPLS